jgi:hypothetical protein
VAVSTWVPLVAVETLHLDISAVMCAAEPSPFVIDVVGTVAGFEVLWCNVVGVVIGSDRVTKRALGK